MFDLVLPTLQTVGAAGVALVVVSAVLGGIAQGTVGFGAAFTTVPALAIVAPELLPGTMLVAALPLTILMLFLERSQLDRTSATRLVLARIPGILMGTVVVVVVDVRWLTLVIGLTLLLAVAVAALGWTMTVTPGREWAAGVVSGATGAATALGGPALALLYRDSDPAVMRPTLAVVWAIGIVMTLTSLGVAGSLNSLQALLGLALSLVVVSGLLVSRQVVARVPTATVRRAVLWWAGIGGVSAIVRVIAT